MVAWSSHPYKHLPQLFQSDCMFWYFLIVFSLTLLVTYLFFPTTVLNYHSEFLKLQPALDPSISSRLWSHARLTSHKLSFSLRGAFLPQSLSADHTRPCSAPSHTNMQNHHLKEHLYKILVIGDLGVGKTSIIKRYVHQNFSPNYRATIGVDFALKVLNLEQETVRLQLWDIAGNF